MDDVTWAGFALAAFGFVFAGLVKGTTGLGFSTTCLPFLVFALGLDRAMPLILVPSITSNLFVHVQAGAFGATWRQFWPMFLALVPGLALGLWLLAGVDLDHAVVVLGAVLVVYAIWTLAHIDAVLPAPLIRTLRAPVGFLTGLVNGLTGSQIMPVLPFLLSQPLERPVFLQAINTSFTMSSVIVALGLWQIGFLTSLTLIGSVLALAPMALGLTLGTRIRDRLPTQAFRQVVLYVLIALGIALIARGLLTG